MKFWQKIYLFSIMAFIVVFNLASIMVIERNHSKMLQQEINNTLSENMSINSSVSAIIPLLRIYDSIEYEKSVLTNIANEFVDKNSHSDIYLEIVDEERRTIYSNKESSKLFANMPSDRKELVDLQANEIKYILRDIADRTFLFTANITEINNKKYTFTYIKEVTPLYEERIDQYRFFVKVDIGACLIYMVVMFFISKGLTKPIDKMIRTAKDIAQGNFSERVQLKSKDEIGTLATNFNAMAVVVEAKINELELHNSEKQRFIDNFTHELKTPLTSIIGYANYLKVTKYNEEIFVNGLQVIYSEAKRLESLSIKLMDLILLKEDRFQMVTENLNDLIIEMESSLKMRAASKNIKIITTCDQCSLKLEKDLIKVLIFNLVDNAIKASNELESITIRTFESDGNCVLEVADNGIGIPADHIDKIFEPFYMADKARTRNNNGAGLGLSICQAVASIHHATIEAISEINRGTTIRVVFERRNTQDEVSE